MDLEKLYGSVRRKGRIERERERERSEIQKKREELINDDGGVY